MNHNRIKELLAKMGKGNKELSGFLDVAPQTVSNWCRNSNQPDVITLFKIAEFLGVEAGDLLTLRKDLRAGKGKGQAKKGK